MIKIRYALDNNNNCIGYDGAHTAEIYCESYQNIYDVLDNNGFAKWHWNGTNFIRRLISEIEASPEFLIWYKKKKRDELLLNIYTKWPQCSRTYDAIRTQYATFKTNVITATTKAEIDALFNNAYIWLGISE